jgi:hypothetical protein
MNRDGVTLRSFAAYRQRATTRVATPQHTGSQRFPRMSLLAPLAGVWCPAVWLSG